MSGDLALEILGYVASALIAISLMMRSIIRLRWINLIGSVCFTIYGVLIEAYPVAVVNLAIVLINVYFLVNMRRSKEAFAVVEMGPESAYLHEFLSFHGADIQSFQPGFAFTERPGQRIFVVLRDLVPAGVVVTEPRDEPGCARVSLDNVTPPTGTSGSATTCSTAVPTSPGVPASTASRRPRATCSGWGSAAGARRSCWSSSPADAELERLHLDHPDLIP